MNLEDTIYKRQSIRSYDSTPLDNQTLYEIRDFIEMEGASLYRYFQWGEGELLSKYWFYLSTGRPLFTK